MTTATTSAYPARPLPTRPAATAPGLGGSAPPPLGCRARRRTTTVAPTRPAHGVWARRDRGVGDDQDTTDPARRSRGWARSRSEEHTSELQSRQYLVCRLLLEK